MESDFNKESHSADLSAFEKASQDENIDPRCIPIRLEEKPPVGDEIIYPDYPEDDHDTWRYLYNRQGELIKNRACEEYFDGQERLELRSDKIPALKNLSIKLNAATSWKVARIPGLLHEEDFFSLLKKSVFPSTDYIRGKSELDYTPAPDMFHDIYGHMPLVTIPSFANFYKYFGEVAGKAKGNNRRRLERIYWFTVEFGLIASNNGPKIYGAGLLSSPKEVIHCLTEKVEKIEFDPNIVSETEYDVWHMQEKLFVIESFESLEEKFYNWIKENNLN